MIVFAFGLFTAGANAQESKKDMMKKEAMEKKEMMKKDGMHKGDMMKKDGMEKADMMKKDAMAKGDMMKKDVMVIELTQVEGKFTTESLNLKPGNYQFRVVNDGVSKDVGFLIQAAKDANADPMKTAVENSFTKTLVSNGSSAYTGVVDLPAGEYIYYCPLNPTPKYSITVK